MPLYIAPIPLTLSWQGYKNDDFGRGPPPKISPNEATEACEGSK